MEMINCYRVLAAMDILLDKDISEGSETFINSFDSLDFMKNGTLYKAVGHDAVKFVEGILIFNPDMVCVIHRVEERLTRHVYSIHEIEIVITEQIEDSGYNDFRTDYKPIRVSFKCRTIQSGSGVTDSTSFFYLPGMVFNPGSFEGVFRDIVIPRVVNASFSKETDFFADDFRFSLKEDALPPGQSRKDFTEVATFSVGFSVL